MKSRPQRPKPRPRPKASRRRYPAGFVPPTPAEAVIPPSQRPKPTGKRPDPTPKRVEEPRGTIGPARPMAGRTPAPEALHVAPLDVLAEAAAMTAMAVETSVFQEQRRADRAIAWALRNRRDLAAPDHRFIAQSVFALFRWHGWVGPLQLNTIEERLLLSWLLDAPDRSSGCPGLGPADRS